LYFLSNAMHNNKAQGEKPQHISRFWIIGAGRFGQIAISRITRYFPNAVLTVVDRYPLTVSSASITAVCADAIDWLAQMLVKNALVDMLVPAIPEHVAAGWLSIQLAKEGFDLKKNPIPDPLLAKLPCAIRGASGQAFVSHADFLCPDNCPEPKARCSHTGKPRPVDMYRLLADLKFGDTLPIVLRSHQLLPGVGGIYPADLWQALSTARDNSHRPLMIATACRCHGVVDILRVQKRDT
jgi:hypothetical protein